MGEIKGYKCPNCDYNEEFRWGFGFLDFEEKNNKSTSLKLELKKEIQDGKYGDLLKEMSELKSTHNLLYDCSEALFQCDHCYEILVANKKEIISGILRKYQQKIIFNQTCPKCKNGNLKEIENTHLICPKCRKAFLETTNIGNFY